MNRAVFESLGTWRKAEDTANGRLRKKAMFEMEVVNNQEMKRCLNVGATSDITMDYSLFCRRPLNSGPGEISRTHVNHRFGFNLLLSDLFPYVISFNST
jgi:hypothetical protein